MNSQPSNENTKYQCRNCCAEFETFYPGLLNADGSVDFCSLGCRKEFNKKLKEMPINTYRDKTDGLDVYEPHSYGIDPSIMEKAETYESIKHFSKENNYDF